MKSFFEEMFNNGPKVVKPEPEKTEASEESQKSDETKKAKKKKNPEKGNKVLKHGKSCLLYTSPSPRD